jgi:Ion channel
MLNFSKPLLSFIDRINVFQLILFTIIMTLFFATGYFGLSNFSHDNGLVIPVDNQKHNQVTFSEAIYFSIITETTLGYGDFRPIGISRLLVCFQVFLGLLLAGFMVAKITSLRDKKLRYATSQAEGFWIELFQYSGHSTMFSFTQIYSDGENLHYDGDNFDEHGNHLESFTGSLVTTEKNVLTFYYKNQKDYFFDNGITELKFYNINKSNYWTNYDAVCIDHGKVEKTEYIGFRASKEQIERMKNRSDKEISKFIKATLSDYELSPKKA